MRTEKHNKTNKYYDIILTDIQLHYQQPANPKSAFRKIFKSIKTNKPGRFFGTIIPHSQNKNLMMSSTLNPQTIKEIQDAQKLGKKIRIIIPKEDIPIYAGKDLIEKLKADKRKKWLRA